MRSLIVTADDFGAAVEVNEAVEAAHRGGILTAASLMVAAPAAPDAIARALGMPALRVGLHLVLVDGRPVLPAAKVSRLVDAHGMLRTDMAVLGAAIAFSRRTRRQLAAEIDAQFEAFAATGLHLDHCNAHKHFHLHPVVGDLLAETGVRFGLRAARVPHEPVDVLRQIETRTARSAGRALAPFSLRLRRTLRSAGISAPDRSFGIHWSGQMTRRRLSALIGGLPDGLSEIYLHPATGPYAGCAPEYGYRDELDALMAPEVSSACRDRALELGGFADFLQAKSIPAAAFGGAAPPEAALARLARRFL